MGNRQDLSHLTVAVSQSPSEFAVGNRAAELGHLDIQVGESNVREAIHPSRQLCFSARAESVMMGHHNGSYL